MRIEVITKRWPILKQSFERCLLNAQHEPKQQSVYDDAVKCAQHVPTHANALTFHPTNIHTNTFDQESPGARDLHMVIAIDLGVRHTHVV